MKITYSKYIIFLQPISLINMNRGRFFMSAKVWCSLAITLSLLTAGCIPQKNTSQKDPVLSTVRTETVVVTPIVTGKTTFKSNVREVSSSKADIVDVLPKGMQVELVGKNGNWYRVKRLNGTGKAGFVYHKLITLDFDNYLGTRGRNKQLAVLHDAPISTAQTPLKIAPQNNFDIIDFENGFYKIKGESFEGYVKSELCVADPNSPIAKTKP